MISCILATDMNDHFKHTIDLSTLISTLEISEGKNVEKLIETDEKNFNKNQQIILSNTVHLSDISNPSKKEHLYDKWVDLILNEFFHQGDLEKKLHLPVSKNYDRLTTTKSKSQLGFITQIVKPYFEVYYNMIPEIKPYLDNLNVNHDRYVLIEKEEAKKN